MGRAEQQVSDSLAVVGGPAPFAHRSARLRNQASQVRRSRAITFLWFAAMRRTSDEVEDRLDVSELIERIAAERGCSGDDTGRHRLLVAEPDVQRSRPRRTAPVVVGIATVLVAATIAMFFRAGADDSANQELDAALIGASSPSPSVAPPVQVRATVPAPAPVASATAKASSTPTATPRRPLAPRPSAPKPKPAVADEGRQAATAAGWKLIDRDEFTGALSDRWATFDGEGNAGEGRRTPDAVSIRNGAMVIRGDADGTTGGLAWRDDRRTGRWEMRAKFPEGDAQYQPTLLLSPESGSSDDGETDFAQTTSASDSVSFVLHHGSDDQESAKKQIDITQWHNYAVEVTSDRVTGYLDGQKWFESTDPDTLPGDAVHPAIQLDWFPKGDPPKPSELQVDWMRVYE